MRDITQRHTNLKRHCSYRAKSLVAQGYESLEENTSIARSLKLDWYIVLLPGTANSTQHYGNREAVGTAIIALVLAFVFSVSLSLAFALLWR